MKEVIQSIDLVGIPRTVYYTPAPAVGGYAGSVDLIASLFQLWQFRIEPPMAQDILDRAIGAYETLARRLFLQCFNPFFWLGWALNKVLSIPFRILGAAGFDGERIEQSVAGKLIKALMGFVAFLGSSLSILDRLGYLGKIRTWIGLMFG